MIRNIFGLNDLDSHDVFSIEKKSSRNNEYLFWYSNRGWQFFFLEVLIVKDEFLKCANVEKIQLAEDSENEFRETINYFKNNHGFLFSLHECLLGKKVKITVPYYTEGKIGDCLEEEHLSILKEEMSHSYWFLIFALQESLKLEITKEHQGNLLEFISHCYHNMPFSPLKNLAKIGRGIDLLKVFPKEVWTQIDEMEDLNLVLYRLTSKGDKVLEWRKLNSTTPDYFVIPGDAKQEDTICHGYNKLSEIIYYLKNFWVRPYIEELQTWIKEK